MSDLCRYLLYYGITDHHFYNTECRLQIYSDDEAFKVHRTTFITLNVLVILYTIKQGKTYNQLSGNTTFYLNYCFLFCSGHFPDFTCRLRCWIHLNPSPQKTHLNGSSSLCRRLCAHRFLGSELLYGHSSHLYCFLL